MKANKNLVSTFDYAKLCGITAAAVRLRIKTGKIIATDINGWFFIDVKKYPPQKELTRGRKKGSELLAV